ncbi:MAG: hypothetical protein ACRDOD_00485 [Streptosporangiaceae bacterium]
MLIGKLFQIGYTPRLGESSFVRGSALFVQPSFPGDRLGLDSRLHGHRPQIASDVVVEALTLDGPVSPARSRCSSEGRPPHGY